MNNSEHRSRARAALSGHWGTAILVSFLAGLLGSTSSQYARFTGKININFPEFMPIVMPIMEGFTITVSLFGLVSMILGGVIQMGSARFHLNLIDRKEAELSDLFSQFSHFGSGLVMYLLSSLFVLLWTTLLIIPGIIAAYSYSMAPYILLEDPNCGGYEAIQRSKQLMNGHKLELFLLDLSFIGWIILSVFTLGIGMLWVPPYMYTARASFYRQLTAPRSGGCQSTTVEF